jgi:hypothetical protein
LELVETQHSSLRSETPSDLWQGVLLTLAKLLVPRSDLVLPVEHIEHEAVKVYPGRAELLFVGETGRKGRVEQVHEHGLARADGTVQVEALWYFVQRYSWRGDSGCLREELAELDLAGTLRRTHERRSDLHALRRDRAGVIFLQIIP